jgi:hypothetical protein
MEIWCMYRNGLLEGGIRRNVKSVGTASRLGIPEI